MSVDEKETNTEKTKIDESSIEGLIQSQVFCQFKKICFLFFSNFYFELLI